MSQLGESGFWKLKKLYFSPDEPTRTVLSKREEDIVQNSPLNCTDDNEERRYQNTRFRLVLCIHFTWTGYVKLLLCF